MTTRETTTQSHKARSWTNLKANDIGRPSQVDWARRSIQASVGGSGAVSATVRIWGSNDPLIGLLLGTITLSGTNADGDGFGSDVPWDYLWPEVTALSGTDAAVRVIAMDER